MSLSERLKEWYKWDVKTEKFNYISDENPKINTNPEKVNVIWFNKQEGVIWICTDNTPNKNIWRGTNGELIMPSTLSKFDIFEDNSAIALWTLDGHLHDLGGQYDGKPNWKVYYREGKFGKCLSSKWNNCQAKFKIDELEKYDIITISAWFRWNGKSSVMPFSFGKYNIYFHYNAMGFNTGNGDIYGIDFPKRNANTWYHIVAEFHRGEYGEIWLNGEKQNLTQKKGSFYLPNAKFSNYFYIFGWGASKGYRNFGLIDQVRLFKRSLTDAEVQILFNEK